MCDGTRGQQFLRGGQQQLAKLVLYLLYLQCMGIAHDVPFACFVAFRSLHQQRMAVYSQMIQKTLPKRRHPRLTPFLTAGQMMLVDIVMFRNRRMKRKELMT